MTIEMNVSWLAGILTWNGKRLLRQTRYEQAVRWFSMALPLVDGVLRAQTLYRRAKVFLEIRHYTLAAQDLEEVVRLVPRFGAAWQYLSHAQHKIGKFREAFTSAQRLLDIDPDNMAGRRYVSDYTKLNPPYRVVRRALPRTYMLSAA